MGLILTIDDDTETLKLLMTIIDKIGYRAIQAKSGDEGVQMAKTGNPDLILLDIMMPDLDGFGVLKLLKKDDLTRGIPVIMVTGKKDKKDIMLAINSGVADYIVKPFNAQTLAKKIKSIINDRQQSHAKDKPTEFLQVERQAGKLHIRFFQKLGSKETLLKVKEVFTPAFLSMTKHDKYIIDLRHLNDLDDNEVTIFEKILSLMGFKNLYVVAGRHYGTLIINANLPEIVQLFISLGDLEVYLDENQD